MEDIDNVKTESKKRISRTMRCALAHPFMIYEVTDPELRSQLSYYRNKDKENNQDQLLQNSDTCYEKADA